VNDILYSTAYEVRPHQFIDLDDWSLKLFRSDMFYYNINVCHVMTTVYIRRVHNLSVQIDMALQWNWNTSFNSDYTHVLCTILSNIEIKHVSIIVKCVYETVFKATTCINTVSICRDVNLADDYVCFKDQRTTTRSYTCRLTRLYRHVTMQQSCRRHCMIN
jgi:hypothetical protein